MDGVPAGGTEAENRQRCSADQPTRPETGLDAEDRENIQHCIAEIPDTTIEEKRNLSASCSTVERAIGAMGYTLKKKSLSSPNRAPLRRAPVWVRVWT